MMYVDLHTIHKIRVSVYFTCGGEYRRTTGGRRQRPLIHGTFINNRRAAALFPLAHLSFRRKRLLSVFFTSMWFRTLKLVWGPCLGEAWREKLERKTSLNPGNVSILKSEILWKRPLVEDGILLAVWSLVVVGAGALGESLGKGDNHKDMDIITKFLKANDAYLQMAFRNAP
ncbi:uncharacterized protein AAES06_000035 [Glossophaga mutica]